MMILLFTCIIFFFLFKEITSPLKKSKKDDYILNISDYENSVEIKNTVLDKIDDIDVYNHYENNILKSELHPIYENEVKNKIKISPQNSDSLYEFVSPKFQKENISNEIEKEKDIYMTPKVNAYIDPIQLGIKLEDEKYEDFSQLSNRGKIRTHIDHTLRKSIKKLSLKKNKSIKPISSNEHKNSNQKEKTSIYEEIDNINLPIKRKGFRSRPRSLSTIKTKKEKQSSKMPLRHSYTPKKSSNLENKNMENNILLLPRGPIRDPNSKSIPEKEIRRTGIFNRILSRIPSFSKIFKKSNYKDNENKVKDLQSDSDIFDIDLSNKIEEEKEIYVYPEINTHVDPVRQATDFQSKEYEDFSQISNRGKFATKINQALGRSFRRIGSSKKEFKDEPLSNLPETQMEISKNVQEERLYEISAGKSTKFSLINQDSKKFSNLKSSNKYSNLSKILIKNGNEKGKKKFEHQAIITSEEHLLPISDDDKSFLRSFEKIPGYSKKIQDLFVSLKDYHSTRNIDGDDLYNQTEIDKFLELINQIILDKSKRIGIWNWKIKNDADRKKYLTDTIYEYISAIEKIGIDQFCDKMHEFAIKNFK